MRSIIHSKGLFIGYSLITVIMMTSTVAFSQTAMTPPGDGTADSPYLISELGHLVWMSDTVAGSTGKYYKMTADIDASSTAMWNDEGTDTSIYDGMLSASEIEQICSESCFLIPGDANLDSQIDVGDLGILAANYGQSSKTWFQGDFNNDGAVDVGDLGILAANYGKGAGTKDMTSRRRDAMPPETKEILR